MSPEILSLKMFQFDEINITNSDIVSRYCSADIYSFSLIAWIVMSQCKENVPTEIPDGIDDYLFAEFLAQSNTKTPFLLGPTDFCTTHLGIWKFFGQKTYIHFVAQEARLSENY